MISDEDLIILSSFEDGELEGLQLLDVRRRLLREPELRRELDAIRVTDKRLRDYAKGIDASPVPGRISRLVRAPIARSAIKLFATAAVMFVMTIGTYLIIPDEVDVEYGLMATMESGQTIKLSDNYVEVIASFKHSDGRYCRELISSKSHRVVCHTDGSWRAVIDVPRLDPPQGVYQPAGGHSASIDDYLRDHIAGSVIDRAEEKKLIQNDWRPTLSVN